MVVSVIVMPVLIVDSIVWGDVGPTLLGRYHRLAEGMKGGRVVLTSLGLHCPLDLRWLSVVSRWIDYSRHFAPSVYSIV